MKQSWQNESECGCVLKGFQWHCQGSSSPVLERPRESKLLQEQRRGSPSTPDSTAKRLCQKQRCQQTLFILPWPEWQENTALPDQTVSRPVFTCLGLDALLFMLSDLASLRLVLSLAGPQTHLWWRCGAAHFSDLWHLTSGLWFSRHDNLVEKKIYIYITFKVSQPFKITNASSRN